MKKILSGLVPAILFTVAVNAEIKLGGTLATGKNQSRAIIELGNGQTTEVCETGPACSRNACDCSVAGYKVLRIEPRKVILLRGGERFTLTLEGIRSADGKTGKYWQSSTHNFSRAKIQGTVDMRGEKALGVLQKLLGELDYKQTDVIRTIQGHALSEKIKWGTVYGSILTAEQIAIEIERDGKLMLLQLRMTQ